MTIYIAVTGAQGSGKSVFTEIAKEKFDIPTYRLGNVIIAECKKRGLEVNGFNMGKMASVLRHEFGDQSITRMALPEIKKLASTKPDIMLIDGVRSFTELTFLRDELGEVILVAIIASLRVRKNRVEARKRIDNQNKGDFEEREHRELGFGLGAVITKADYYILNEDLSKREFIRHIDRILTRILKNQKK
ncbi:MAG: AAA family ATPase [Asgard group archaeon]|nr:AAA family ATPase [Asgard group archaeon]